MAEYTSAALAPPDSDDDDNTPNMPDTPSPVSRITREPEPDDEWNPTDTDRPKPHGRELSVVANTAPATSPSAIESSVAAKTAVQNEVNPASPADWALKCNEDVDAAASSADRPRTAHDFVEVNQAPPKLSAQGKAKAQADKVHCAHLTTLQPDDMAHSAVGGGKTTTKERA